jgi:OmpA-OmpF porin, OOP family
MARRIQRGLLAGAATLPLILTTGCLPSPGQTTATECGWTSTVDDAGQGSDRVSSSQVIVVDRSASFQPATMQSHRAKQLQDLIIRQTLLDFGSGYQRKISIGSFDGATVSWSLDGIALPLAVGTAGGKQKRARENIQQCLAPVVDTILTRPASTPGTDTIGAYLAAAKNLDATAKTKRITLITDGLNNQGCGDVGVSAEIGRLVEKCATQHALPTAKGVLLQVPGLGQPAAADDVPLTEQKAWLNDLWMALAAKTGSTFSVTEIGLDVEPEMESAESGKVDDPAVRVPVIPPPFTPEPGVEVIPIPADLLFATASADLSRKAEEILRRSVLPYLGRRYKEVEVIGRTDSRGTEAYNQDLSERRSQAVAGFLSSHGFSKVDWSGVGETQPVDECQQIVNGVQDGACLTRNRRVDVKITLVQEDS